MIHVLRHSPCTDYTLAPCAPHIEDFQYVSLARRRRQDMPMATDNAKRPIEHPIDRPPDTDPQQGHEHPEADPRPPHLRQANHDSHGDEAPGGVAPSSLDQGGAGVADDSAATGGSLLQRR